MPSEASAIDRLIADLEAIRMSAFWLEGEHDADLEPIRPDARDSARNLLHYLALRRRDLRSLQDELAALGLSSLGRAESHVLGTIEPVLATLHGLAGRDYAPSGGARAVRFLDGRSTLEANTLALFGPPVAADGPGGAVRVMVTMPAFAAVSYELIRDLMTAGMNCVRINCAHEGPDVWSSIVRNVEEARSETGRECLVEMDLGGPKIRTGPIEPGPRVVHWQPKRDPLGNMVRPAGVWITPAEAPEGAPPSMSATVPLPGAIVEKLRVGDKIVFREVRGQKRSIRLRAPKGSSWIAESKQWTYLSADCDLTVRSKSDDPIARGLPESFRADALAPVEQSIELTAGDTIVLTSEPIVAKPVERDVQGRTLEEPRIACLVPEVFRHVRVGERVLFDDGKLGGIALDASPEELRVRITRPLDQEKRLRADKGLNFPDSDLDLPAVTAKDREDLDFICEHADIVGLSFVNGPEDVTDLYREIEKRTKRDIGVILKIETRRGFENLPRILLAAMRRPRVGVMIARGDLAVECGYERLAEVQEEVLWLCEAAHIPAVWATQVLERLSKKGIPTRAEISDAAMGERAECVMLNKGEYVVETVRVLRDILGRMREHAHKKTSQLRALSVSHMLEPARGRNADTSRGTGGAARDHRSASPAGAANDPAERNPAGTDPA